VIGTAIVWIPTVIYLIIVGKIKSAIFFALWSIIVVGSLDNVIRPFFMKGAGEMSTLLVFLSIMGGVQYFGLLGVIYGPLILGSALVLLYLYEMEFLTHQGRHGGLPLQPPVVAEEDQASSISDK